MVANIPQYMKLQSFFELGGYWVLITYIHLNSEFAKMIYAKKKKHSFEKQPTPTSTSSTGCP
jgi:hypothetical protein